MFESERVSVPCMGQDSTLAWRTNRDFRYYTELFNHGTHGEPLRGKRILDLGAGNSDFAQEANKIPGTKVVQLDASYSKYPPTDTRDKICAAIQQLPFRDGFFDEVIASHSVMYIPEMDIEQSLKEMLRIIRVGGSIKIFPVIYLPINNNGRYSNNNVVELHPNAKLTRPDSDPDYFMLEIKKENSDADRHDLIEIILGKVMLTPWCSLTFANLSYNNTNITNKRDENYSNVINKMLLKSSLEENNFKKTKVKTL